MIKRKKQIGLSPELQEDYELSEQEKEAKISLIVLETTEMQEEIDKLKKRTQKRDKRTKRICKILGIALIIIIMLMLLVQCSQQGRLTLPGQEDGTVVDVEKGNTVAIDDMEKPLPTELIDPRYSEQTISMNKVPVFETGLSKGNVNIKNDKINVYNQVVEIYIVKTMSANGQEYTLGDLIYTSSLVEIGRAIEKDELDVNLPAGEYSCVASFLALEVDTDVFVGRTNALMTITVKNTAP